MGRLKKEIDKQSLTDEKLVDILNECKSNNDVFRYFGLAGGPTDYKELKELCLRLGFDEKKISGVENKKVTRKCQNCGKPLKSGQYKFCCQFCAATVNNRRRKRKATDDKPKKEKLYKKITKEELEKLLLVDRRSFTYIGKIYKTGHRQIKLLAIKFGIDISGNVNRKQRKDKKICEYCGKEIKSFGERFCSQECCNEYRKEQKYKYYIEHQDDFANKEINYLWLKPHILDEQKNECAICGCKPFHNGKELHFILDHIDGDATNNTRKNLRLICPNCDSQLDTFKSRNIGKSKRKYKPYRNGKLIDE